MKKSFLIAAVACVVYVVLRLWNLTASCLWFDEIFSVHAAQHDWHSLFSFVARDIIHPPLFYVLLKLWIGVGGESLLWLRLFSVAASALAIVPVVYLCRELKLYAYEIAAVILLLGVNGSLIKYAQEVRMYSLLFCLTAFSIWLFVRWARRENATWIWLLLCNLLLIYTHYFGWLVVGTEIILALCLSKRRVKFLLPSAIWTISFLPWMAAVYSAYTHSGAEQNLNWAERPGIRQLFGFVAVLHQFFYFQQSSNEPSFSLLAIPVLLICAVAIAALFLYRRDGRDEMNILWVLAALPLVIAFVASLISPFSIWGTRHLIVIFAPYFVLVVMGFRYIKPLPVRYGLAAALALILLPASIFFFTRKQTVFSWCGWEALAAQAKSSEIATVYAFEDFVAYELWFSLEREARGKFHVVAIEDNKDIPEDKAYFIPRVFDAIEKASENSIAGDRFWVAVRGIGENEEHPLWRSLRAKGYRMGAPLKFKAQDTDAYLVPVSREMTE